MPGVTTRAAAAAVAAVAAGLDGAKTVAAAVAGANEGACDGSGGIETRLACVQVAAAMSTVHPSGRRCRRLERDSAKM